MVANGSRSGCGSCRGHGHRHRHQRGEERQRDGDGDQLTPDEPIPPGTSAAVFTALDKQLGTTWLYSGRAPDYDWRSLVGAASCWPSEEDLFSASSGGNLVTRGPGAARVAEVTSSVLFTGGYADATNIESTTRAVLYDVEANEAVDLEMTAPRIPTTPTPCSPATLRRSPADSTATSCRRRPRSSPRPPARSPPSGPWASRAAGMPRAPLPDGRVLITGGLVPAGIGPATIDDKTAEIFDPATACFRQLVI